MPMPRLGMNSLVKVALSGFVVYGAYWYWRQNNPPRPSEPATPPLPEVSHPAMGDFILGQARIAAETLRLLHKTDKGNVAFSPNGIYNVTTALWMGATGPAETKLANFLGSTSSPDTLVRTYSPRRSELETRGVLLGGTSIWADSQTPLAPAYRQRFNETFGGSTRESSFNSKASAEIEKWVSDITKGKVAQLEPFYSAANVAAIVDVAYFKDRWSVRFDKSRTKDRPFTLLSGSDVMAPAMEGEDISYEFWKDANLTGLRLPFRNHLAFVVLVPTKDMASMLASPSLQEALGPMNRFRRAKGRIQMPRWKIEKSNDLRKILTDLGLGDLFQLQSPPSFTKMFGPKVDAWMGQSRQKVGLELNEDGAEAYTFTQVLIMVKASKPTEKNFVIDQPFVFAIVDPQGPIYFAGIITEPRN